jgi:hypothetical protein
MTGRKYEANAEIRIESAAVSWETKFVLTVDINMTGSSREHWGNISPGYRFVLNGRPAWSSAAVRLVKQQDNLRMLGVRTGNDVTDAMNHLIALRIPELAHHICTALFKKDSPSCGFQRVKVVELRLCTSKARELPLP